MFEWVADMGNSSLVNDPNSMVQTTDEIDGLSQIEERCLKDWDQVELAPGESWKPRRINFHTYSFFPPLRNMPEYRLNWGGPSLYVASRSCMNLNVFEKWQHLKGANSTR